MSSEQQSSEDANEPRFKISDKLKQQAKGALKIAVELMGAIATATQNVTYLSSVSSVITQLLKAKEEVDSYKENWRAVASVAKKLQALLERIHKRRGPPRAPGESPLPDALLEPLTELEKCILKTLETINECNAESKRWRDRARTILSRNDLAGVVDQCRKEMQAALDLFTTEIVVATFLSIEDLRDTGAISQNTLQSDIQLPPAPAVFHGRTQEVDHVVGHVLHRHPARVAVLGPGGIGKTSIALAVIHKDDVAEKFEEKRMFLSCEAIRTAEGIVRELSKLYGVPAGFGGDDGSISARNRLLLHMRTLTDSLLCLDNFDTPWHADTESVEDLLARIAFTSKHSLLITLRGTRRPGQIAWTQPVLQPIAPIDFEAACLIWESIYGSRDEYSDQLLRAVDGMPLAVTVLAQLAESESAKTLWARWQTEQTGLLHIGNRDHRLLNVDVSIRLSLNSIHLQQSEGAVELLSVLCTLPQGIPESRIEKFAHDFAELIPAFRDAVLLLKQASLAFLSADGFLRVLSPIRLHMQTHHTIPDAHLTCLADMYRELVSLDNVDFNKRKDHAQDHLQQQLSNITAVLHLCLTRDVDRRSSTFHAIYDFSEFCILLGVFNCTFLSDAISHYEQNTSPTIEAQLWEMHGVCLYRTSRYDDAATVLAEAFRLHGSSGTEAGQARCLKDLGQTYHMLDKDDEAVLALKTASGLYKRVKDRDGYIGSLLALSGVFVDSSRMDEAQERLTLALNHIRKADSKQRQAQYLQVVGLMSAKLEKFDDSESAFRSALALHAENGDRLPRIITATFLGIVLCRLRRFEEARSVLESAHDLSLDFGDVLAHANVQHQLGLACMLGDDLEAAEQYLLDAVGLYVRVGREDGLDRARKELQIVRDALKEGQLSSQPTPPPILPIARGYLTRVVSEGTISSEDDDI